MTDPKLISYIIDFLIGPIYPAEQAEDGYRKRFNLVGYTRDPEEMKQYPIVIYPSTFFDLGVYGSERSMPSLPLSQWRGIPLLFGSAEEGQLGPDGPIIIYADLIASSFFLISRYEEMYKRSERNQYGCFPGVSSLGYRAGFAERPIVDEYGAALRELILEHNLLERYGISWEARPHTFSRVFLTHDLLRPAVEAQDLKGWRIALRPLLKHFPRLLAHLTPASLERTWVLPRGLERNLKLQRASAEEVVRTIFFVRSASRRHSPLPTYHIDSRFIAQLEQVARRHGAKVGLLCSHRSAENPEQLEVERRRLRKAIPGSAECSRFAQLTQREPEDMTMLYSAGMRHDFSMGYNDVAGFRLGTCRAVRFINPNTRLLTDLMLHPICLRDESLAEYLKQEEGIEEAKAYCLKMIELVARYHGDLTIAWSAPHLHPHKHTAFYDLYKYIIEEVERITLNDPRLHTPRGSRMRKKK